MGSLGPRLVYGHDGGNAHPWHMALVHGLFVLGAAAALVTNWRAHAMVRLSERRNRREVERYLEVAGVLHVFIDADGRVRMANPMTLETLGRTKDEFIGADWFDVAVPADEGEARRAAFAAMTHGPTDRHEVDNALLCADGSIRLVQWVVTVVRDDDGVITGMLSTGTDVTERRALEARLDRERRDLATLRCMAQDVASLDDARQALVDAAADLADAAIATIVEPSEDGAELEFTTATVESFVGKRVRIGHEPSAAATAFVERRPVFVADEAYSRTSSRRLFHAAGAKSVLCQPIMTGDDVLGVLVVGWPDPRQALEERPAELVRLAADEAARALQRRAAMHRLESAALADALTGVPNRRAFEAELPRAMARATRTGEPLALATMDLNGFKALNDREGHAAGDRVLKEVAAAWQGALRATDLLARIGGDEFVALLPMCGGGDMAVVAERLRGAVTHAAGSGLGIVQWDGAESPAELVRRADEALYADKARGSAARLADPVRLAALEATGLLDAPSQPELDEVSRMVSWLLDVPVATVSLVDDRRQFFAGACGLTGDVAEDRQTPLSTSFCQHAVSAGRPLIVRDAREVPLLKDNPAIEARGVIAYAGIPLIDAGDNVLGVLCAIDHEPRDWSDDDIATLRRLAQRAIGELMRAAAAPV
jgi:diguanylate cyclase (GGDEF)-like protein/PAS domain S-box-containing protein